MTETETGNWILKAYRDRSLDIQRDRLPLRKASTETGDRSLDIEGTGLQTDIQRNGIKLRQVT